MVVVIAASLVRAGPAAAGTAELVQALDQLASAFPGGAGLWIADPLAARPLYARSDDEPVIMASLYKLGVLAEAERRVETGELRYGDLITIHPEDVTADGSFFEAGTELTLDDALEAMVTISDNGTALALWHLLGGANIDAMLSSQGLTGFHVAFDESEDNVATPRAVGTFLARLARKQLVSAAVSERMLARLARQQINDRLPAALPAGVTVAHKTGDLVGITHDAGIIYTPSGPRVVVAMTWDAHKEDADAFIANVGALVYGATLDPPANARYAVPRVPVEGDSGSSVRVTITVTNSGSAAWSASGPGVVGLRWELRDDGGGIIVSSPLATRLPPLAPGRSANVGLQIPTPSAPGLFRVTVGLVDAEGRALAALGAATASFELITHLPHLVSASVDMPTALHRGEPSLLVTRYVALATAGAVDHPLSLTWRALDTRTGRVVEEGTVSLGLLRPSSRGTVFSTIVAPRIQGTYRFSYEVREGDVAVSETATRLVTIYGPRTYPDGPTGRIIAPRASPAPSASPRAKIPFPSPSTELVPRIDLPPLPTPKGKTTPTAAPR